MWPGFNSRTQRQMWVEFVVGSRSCSERFFSGYSSFPLSSKTNISKFQFNLESEGHRFVSHQDYYVPPSLNKVYLFIYSFIYCSYLTSKFLTFKTPLPQGRVGMDFVWNCTMESTCTLSHSLKGLCHQHVAHFLS